MIRTRSGGNIFAAFKATILKFAMIAPGDKVLAACSGGPDSVALCRLLLELRKDMPLDILVAHFNHRLRPSASADEDFVRKMAETWVLPLVRESRNVRLYATRRKINLEEAGRILRYDFLERSARKAGATKIATGHSMTDQAETFLMRILRGTGLTGLRGIAPVSLAAGRPLVRPLIEIKRDQILAFLQKKGIPFREDETNLDRRYLRNRIRHELLPLLEASYQPRAVERLSRLSALLREEEELLDEFVRALAEPFISGDETKAVLDAGMLALLPPSLARRVTREFLRRLKGDLRSVSFDSVEALCGLKNGKETELPGKMILRREGDRIAMKRPMKKTRSFERRWTGKRLLVLGVPGMAFQGKIRNVGKRQPLKNDDRRSAVVDYDKLEFPLTVRSRRPGDRYRPLGAPGKKKLKEILRAKGTPIEERDSRPVFLSRGEILWVPGLPVSEDHKVDPKTRVLFEIERLKRKPPQRKK